MDDNLQLQLSDIIHLILYLEKNMHLAEYKKHIEIYMLHFT